MKIEDIVKAINELAANDKSSLISKLNDSLKDTSDGVEQLGSALKGFSNLSIQNTDTLNGLVNSFGKLQVGSQKFFSSLSELTGVVGLEGIFNAAIAPINETTEALKNAAEFAQNVAEGFDAIDEGTRTLYDSQFELAANIGLGFNEAKKFADTYRDIVSYNSELSQQGFYVNAEDFKDITKALQTQGMAMTDLAERTDVAGKSLSYLQVMTMQARAMGMDVESYARKMADMVRKTGLSMEDSMKLMASTQDISKETGLRVDEVTQSLEGATNGFQRMGTTISFGMPVLKGFAASITEVGLGISQAGDLASEFSKSLMGIVNNPALAYMTSVKGGFSESMGGGGGILNPSIQMQSMMLDQSPESQAELAKNLSIGMRETLKSFTGGDIISVKQAAESPELQSRFYTQQQMLGSQFGISDTATQNRVLEYLQKLEEATYAGDDETAASLERQIAEAAQANDETMGLQQKISLAMDKSVILVEKQLSLIKGIYGGIMLGVENKSGKDGENEFIKRMGKNVFDDINEILGDKEKISKMNAEELEQYNKAKTPETTTGSIVSGAASAKPGDASVATTAGQSINRNLKIEVVVSDKTTRGVDVETGVGGSPKVVPTP